MKRKAEVRNCLLFLSGQPSFELLQKELMDGIPMAVVVGVPSSLAVQVTREFDITVVGFPRADQFNADHGTERLVTDDRKAESAE
jgi:FdhD protein